MSTNAKYLWEFVRGAQRAEKKSNEETWGGLIKSMVMRDGVLVGDIENGKHKAYEWVEGGEYFS